MEGKKRGRPLGSGVKNYRILGCRFTEGEYEFISEYLKLLKKKHSKNSDILLHLFEQYSRKIEKKEKTYRLLGYDFTKSEYESIMKNMKTLRKEYPEEKELILHLFDKYELNKRIINK